MPAGSFARAVLVAAATAFSLPALAAAQAPPLPPLPPPLSVPSVPGTPQTPDPATVIGTVVPSSSTPKAPATPAAATAATAVSAVNTLEAQLLGEINALRRSRRLVPLRAHTALASVAASHSTSMARNGFFSHNSVDGSAFWKRVEAKYGSTGRATWSVGENLAWAAPSLSARQVVEMWMNSPPHRLNLLDPKWREVGLGGVRAIGARGAYKGLDVMIMTADFGVRR